MAPESNRGYLDAYRYRGEISGHQCTSRVIFRNPKNLAGVGGALAE
jgi:hypothetical protein